MSEKVGKRSEVNKLGVMWVLSVALLGTQEVPSGLSSKHFSYVLLVEVAVVRYIYSIKYFIHIL